MKCIVLNLERSDDRREQITKELHSRDIKFEISIGKDKFDLTHNDYEEFADLDSKSIDWSHPIVPGVLACWISHQKIWKNCLESDSSDTVTILEDDVIISEKFKQALQILDSNKAHFDLIFLGIHYPNKTFKPLIEIGDGFKLGIVKYQNIGTQGYLINRRAMQRLTEQFPKFQTLPIDDIMHSPWLTDLRTYTLAPSIVFHRTDQESLIYPPLAKGKPDQNSVSIDDWPQDCLSISRCEEWQRRWRKRVWYFQNTFGKS